VGSKSRNTGSATRFAIQRSTTKLSSQVGAQFGTHGYLGTVWQQCPIVSFTRQQAVELERSITPKRAALSQPRDASGNDAIRRAFSSVGRGIAQAHWTSSDCHEARVMPGPPDLAFHSSASDVPSWPPVVETVVQHFAFLLDSSALEEPIYRRILQPTDLGSPPSAQRCSGQGRHWPRARARVSASVHSCCMTIRGPPITPAWPFQGRAWRSRGCLPSKAEGTSLEGLRRL